MIELISQIIGYFMGFLVFVLIICLIGITICNFMIIYKEHELLFKLWIIKILNRKI